MHVGAHLACLLQSKQRRLLSLQAQHGAPSAALLRLLACKVGAGSSQLLLLEQGLVGSQAWGLGAKVGSGPCTGVHHAQLGSQGIHLVGRRIHQQLHLGWGQACKGTSFHAGDAAFDNGIAQARAKCQAQYASQFNVIPWKESCILAKLVKLHAGVPARKFWRFCCCAAWSWAWR